MSKSLLYRLFGIGKIPAQYQAILAGEGVVLSDEGVKGSVTYRNFRSPTRYSNWKRQWYPASIALTNSRLLAFAYSNPIIDVPLNDARFGQLQFSLEAAGTLLVAFDASLFHIDWSGTIEYRFRTTQAQAFLD
ncbi:MAG: hypothetical protein ABWZ66_07560, partial [Pyrinomonadaceae bacterium]